MMSNSEESRSKAGIDPKHKKTGQIMVTVVAVMLLITGLGVAGYCIYKKDYFSYFVFNNNVFQAVLILLVAFVAKNAICHCVMSFCGFLHVCTQLGFLIMAVLGKGAPAMLDADDVSTTSMPEQPSWWKYLVYGVLGFEMLAYTMCFIGFIILGMVERSSGGIDRYEVAQEQSDIESVENISEEKKE